MDYRSNPANKQHSQTSWNGEKEQDWQLWCREGRFLLRSDAGTTRLDEGKGRSLPDDEHGLALLQTLLSSRPENIWIMDTESVPQGWQNHLDELCIFNFGSGDKHRSITCQVFPIIPRHKLESLVAESNTRSPCTLFKLFSKQRLRKKNFLPLKDVIRELSLEMKDATCVTEWSWAECDWRTFQKQLSLTEFDYHLLLWHWCILLFSMMASDVGLSSPGRYFEVGWNIDHVLSWRG